MITLQEMAVFNSLFLKTIKGMKNKKSSGRDEVTQEQMILGAEVLTVPLTRIINSSISEGKFPEAWKVGVVTPVLKNANVARIHLQCNHT